MKVRLFALASALLTASAANAQITFGQTDTFTTGTQNWSGANQTWISGGGHGGASDAFIRWSSVGGSGPNSRMAGFNTAQWSGNYPAVGVNALTVDFDEISGPELDMRLVLFDSTGSTQWESTNDAVLSSNGEWGHFTFILTDANFVQVEGTTSFTDTLSNVSRLMFRHNAIPSAGGDPVVATLNIDNVQAVPEPCSLIGLGLGAILLGRRRLKKS